MSKIVIAGKSDCPYFAKAELLADDLQTNLPNFSAHKISIHPEKWPEWIQETLGKHGWREKHDDSSPIVWRELVDRGGKGLLLGGSNDFEEYVYQTYGLKLSLKTQDIIDTAKENLQYKAEEIKEQEKRAAAINPLICVVTKGTSPVSNSLYPHLISGATFGSKQEVSIRVLDDEACQQIGGGVVMELQDIASGLLRQSAFFSDPVAAFKNADVIVLLDDLFPDHSVENELLRKHLYFAKVKSHFEAIGRNIKDNAKRTCKVLVAGEVPINFATSVLVKTCAPTILSYNIAGLANHKEKTAKALLGSKINVNGSTVHDVIFWGNLTGEYKVDTKWSKVSSLRNSSITGPSWFCRPTIEMLHDNKWLETEFLAKLETRNDELATSMKHKPFMLTASAIQETLAAWFLGSNPAFKHNLAVYLKNPVYGFPEDMVVCLPVKFYPGAYEVVEDLDVTKSKGKNDSADQSEEDEEEDEPSEWSEFVERVVDELRLEQELSVGMPEEKKPEREKTELDQTDAAEIEDTHEDGTVLIEKEEEPQPQADVNEDEAETARGVEEVEDTQPEEPTEPEPVHEEEAGEVEKQDEPKED